MNKMILSALLLTALLTGCKKDEDFNPANDPVTGNQISTNSYEANQNLLDANAEHYIVCDVEGIDTLQKINMQNSRSTCCPGENCSICQGVFRLKPHLVNSASHPGTDLTVEVLFFGPCNDCSFDDMVKPGKQTLFSLDHYYGTSVQLLFPDGTWFFSSKVSSAEQANDEIEVLKIEEKSSGPGHYVTVRFNCTLKQYQGNKIIRLKNAVFRTSMSY